MRGVKVLIGEFGQLSHDQQADYLADVIDKNTSAPLKEGSTRFDALLGLVGIVTPLDEAVKRTLFEMGQVRNVIVHRGSFVDKRLVVNCPWLGYKSGDRLIVTRASIGEYFNATIEFCGARLLAARRSFGAPDPRPDLLSE